MTRVRKVVMPVAGLGSRFLPATKAVPKELLPLVDRPLISYAIEEARRAGMEEFVFVSARGKDAIADHLDPHPFMEEALENAGKHELSRAMKDESLVAGRAIFVRQDAPLGLGHAIWCARHAVGNEPFAVMLPDDVLLGAGRDRDLQALVEVRESFGGHVAAVEEVPRDALGRYGVLDVASDDGTRARARGLVEKPSPEEAPSNLGIVGRYVLGPEIFESLAAHKRGAGGEVQLTDAICERLGVEPFHGVRLTARRYDCGAKEGFLEATVAAALERNDLSGTMRRILASYTQQAGSAA